MWVSEDLTITGAAVSHVGVWVLHIEIIFLHIQHTMSLPFASKRDELCYCCGHKQDINVCVCSSH